ncbi:hypothetical protein Btru_053280 [Bulinus truncatus]|nr:hypothetical protein Btru_053280 [Bulinus truncatus]
MQKMASLRCVVISRRFVFLVCLSQLVLFSLVSKDVLAQDENTQCDNYQSYQQLNESWRSVTNHYNPDDEKCDEHNIKVDQWFMVGATSQGHIPTQCVKNDICGARVAMWIDLGGQSVPDDGKSVVIAHLCGAFNVLNKYDCCVLRTPLKVANCSGRMIYKLLQPIDRCPVAICFQDNYEPLPKNITAKFGENYFEPQKNASDELTTEITTIDDLEATSQVPASDTPTSQSEVSTSQSETSTPQLTSDDTTDLDTPTETTPVSLPLTEAGETTVNGPTSGETGMTGNDTTTQAAAAAPSPDGDTTSSAETVEPPESTTFDLMSTGMTSDDLSGIKTSAASEDSTTSPTGITSTDQGSGDVTTQTTTEPAYTTLGAVGTPEEMTTELYSTPESSPLPLVMTTTDVSVATTWTTEVPSPPSDEVTSTAAVVGETSPELTDATHQATASTEEDSTPTPDETTRHQEDIPIEPPGETTSTPVKTSTLSILDTSDTWTDSTTESTTEQTVSVSHSVQETSPSKDTAVPEQAEAQSTSSSESSAIATTPTAASEPPAVATTPTTATMQPETMKPHDAHKFSVFVFESVNLIFKGQLSTTQDVKFQVADKMNNFLRRAVQKEEERGQKAFFNLTSAVDTCHSHNDTCIKFVIQSTGRKGVLPAFDQYDLKNFYKIHLNYTLVKYCIENDGGCSGLDEEPSAQASKTQFERNAAVYITVIVLCVVCVVVIAVGIFCTKVWRRGTYSAGDNVERAPQNTTRQTGTGYQSPLTDEQIMKDEVGNRPEVQDKGSSNGSALDGGENSTWVIPLDDAPDFPPPNNEDTKL